MRKVLILLLLVTLMSITYTSQLFAADAPQNSSANISPDKNADSTENLQGAKETNPTGKTPASIAKANNSNAELSCKYYTVEIPSDWKAIMPPTENQGMTSAIFAKNSGSAVVTMVIGPRGGADVKMIAGMFAEQFKADKTPVEKNGQYTFTFTQQGMPCQAWVSAHNDVFMVTSITGNRKDAQSFIKDGIKSTDYAKLLPQF